SSVAALVAAVYAPLGMLFSPIFPFSSVPMYAEIDGYYESHVPIFLADGEPADPAHFVDFRGVDPQSLTLPTPASLDFITERHRWYVETHTWDGEGQAPEVPVAFGWSRYTATDHGVERGPIEIVATGTARRP